MSLTTDIQAGSTQLRARTSRLALERGLLYAGTASSLILVVLAITWVEVVGFAAAAAAACAIEHGEALDPRRPTHARRLWAAHGLHQAVIAAAGQNRALGAKGLGGELKRRMFKLGCSRAMVAGLLAAELSITVAVSAMATVVMTVLTARYVDEILRGLVLG